MVVRVLQVMYPLGTDGVTQVVMSYARHIDVRRVQMDFLLLTPKHWDERTLDAPIYHEIRARGGRIFTLPKPSALFSTLLPQFLPRCLRHLCHLDKPQLALESLLKMQNYHIVHCHLTKEFRYVMRAAQTVGIPCRIVHSHGSVRNRKVLRKREFMLWWQGQYPATHFWGCSHWANISRFGESFANEGNTEILPNAIDCNMYQFSPEIRAQYREQFGFNDVFVVGHVGRYSRAKNQLFLIKVFKFFLNVRPDAVLCLVGDGPMEETLRNYATELGIQDHVHFLTNRTDVPSLYQMFDLFVFPSIIEGLGLVAVEAQAAGLPVVMSANIPAEATIVPLAVKRCALSASENVWVENMLSFAWDFERKDVHELLQKEGWEISETAQKLTDFYEKAESDSSTRLNIQ